MLYNATITFLVLIVLGWALYLLAGQLLELVARPAKRPRIRRVR